MKRTIVGLSDVFHWADKKTGKPRHAINVFVEAPARNVKGVKVWQLFVDDSFPAFSEIATDVDHGRHDLYLNTICDVEYNEQGFLEEVEFNPKNSSSK